MRLCWGRVLQVEGTVSANVLRSEYAWYVKWPAGLETEWERGVVGGVSVYTHVLYVCTYVRVLLWCLGCEERSSCCQGMFRGTTLYLVPGTTWTLSHVLSLIPFCSSQLNQKGSDISPCPESFHLILSHGLIQICHCSWPEVGIQADKQLRALVLRENWKLH